jgi:hypothetical protein
VLEIIESRVIPGINMYNRLTACSTFSYRWSQTPLRLIEAKVMERKRSPLKVATLNKKGILR